jgi:hypothetical protein
VVRPQWVHADGARHKAEDESAATPPMICRAAAKCNERATDVERRLGAWSWEQAGTCVHGTGDNRSRLERGKSMPRRQREAEWLRSARRMPKSRVAGRGSVQTSVADARLRVIGSDLRPNELANRPCQRAAKHARGTRSG